MPNKSGRAIQRGNGLFFGKATIEIIDVTIIIDAVTNFCFFWLQKYHINVI